MSDATADMSLQESCIDASRHLSVEVNSLAPKADELERENAKLRELVARAWGLFLKHGAVHPCDLPEVDAVRGEMRELGVEVGP